MLKTPNTIVLAYGEIKLVLTKKFPLYYLALLVLERAAQASVGKSQQALFSH